jgi:hypothetical protein
MRDSAIAVRATFDSFIYPQLLRVPMASKIKDKLFVFSAEAKLNRDQVFSWPFKYEGSFWAAVRRDCDVVCCARGIGLVVQRCPLFQPNSNHLVKAKEGKKTRCLPKRDHPQTQERKKGNRTK